MFQIERSNDNTMLYSIEDMVTRVLPTINLPLFQALKGRAQWEPLQMDIPLPQATVHIVLKSAQECINVAPLYEGDPVDAKLTKLLLDSLLDKLGLPHEDVTKSLIDDKTAYGLSDKLTPNICYLPGAGQTWNAFYMRAPQLLLMQIAFPDESRDNLGRMLAKGISHSDIEYLNQKINHKLLASDGHFYWLTVQADTTTNRLNVRDLIKIEGRHAKVVRRRLIEDNAL